MGNAHWAFESKLEEIKIHWVLNYECYLSFSRDRWSVGSPIEISVATLHLSLLFPAFLLLPLLCLSERQSRGRIEKERWRSERERERVSLFLYFSPSIHLSPSI